jgi:hypothetical protein
MDANRNRAAVAFDVLGPVVGSPTMGKPEENEGDSFDNFDCFLSDDLIEKYFQSPFVGEYDLLGTASARFVYDLSVFHRTGTRPTIMSMLTRETHVQDLSQGEKARILMNFFYFDGRQWRKKYCRQQ